jgi:hypothetical protein
MDTCGVLKLVNNLHICTLYTCMCPHRFLVCRDQYPPRRFSRRPRARLASRLPGLEGGVTSRLQYLQTTQQPQHELV